MNAVALATKSWRRAENPQAIPSLRGCVIAGTTAILMGFGSFVAWGYTVELDSAALATGQIVVDSRRKPITHLEGGILKALLVREGEAVKAGQPLVALENIRAKSDLGQLQVRRVGLLAKLARLTAEQEAADAIAFPDELMGSADPYLQEIIRNETRLFEKRRETLLRSLDAQHRQIDVFAAEAAAASAQLEANARQQELLTLQVEAIRTLAGKGFAAKTQLAEYEAKLSVLYGDGGEYAANKARAEQSMAGARAEIAKTETGWQSDIADAMQQARIELSALNDNITNAQDVLRRVDVVSPEDGVVVNIQYRTPGGVIPGGTPIMEIVPGNDNRIIEARIDPRDIDSVHVGADVQVKLAAYGIRQTPPLDGNLTYVAADQSVDERTGSAFYFVRAEISQKALDEAPQVELHPGMPADVVILNRPRLAIDYIISPFTESFQRAFREE